MVFAAKSLGLWLPKGCIEWASKCNNYVDTVCCWVSFALLLIFMALDPANQSRRGVSEDGASKGDTLKGGVSRSEGVSHQLSDAVLWQLLREGRKDALGEIYDRHAALVYGLSFKVLGNAQEAEDLTQDIFINLSERPYDPARGALRTFLMVLTRSRASDRLRSRQSARRSRKTWQADVLPRTPNLSTDDMVAAERSKAVNAALDQLSEPEQQVLRLAYFEGLTQAAIAQRLNQPLGTIKSRSRRGLLKLRQVLSARGEV